MHGSVVRAACIDASTSRPFPSPGLGQSRTDGGAFRDAELRGIPSAPNQELHAVLPTRNESE